MALSVNDRVANLRARRRVASEPMLSLTTYGNDVGMVRNAFSTSLVLLRFEAFFERLDSSTGSNG